MSSSAIPRTPAKIYCSACSKVLSRAAPPSWILEASAATAAAVATRRMRQAASASSRCTRHAPTWGLMNDIQRQVLTKGRRPAGSQIHHIGLVRVAC